MSDSQRQDPPIPNSGASTTNSSSAVPTGAAEPPKPSADSTAATPSPSESTSGRTRESTRSEPTAESDPTTGNGTAADKGSAGSKGSRSRRRPQRRRGAVSADVANERNPELPDRHIEGRPKSKEAAERALVRKPKIGDSRPAPPGDDSPADAKGLDGGTGAEGGGKSRRRRRGGQGGQGDQKGSQGGGSGRGRGAKSDNKSEGKSGDGQKQGDGRRRRRGGRSNKGQNPGAPVAAVVTGKPVELDDATYAKRRGKERGGRPVGRYMMAVHVKPEATQIAVLEGRNLIEHYVSRPADNVSQIHGNVYLGRVQNVLPGMEAAFVDIGTPKNAVLYRGDVHYDPADVDGGGGPPRIEQMLKARQSIICQVTKNPIAHKGARLTQEVSLPGRFVVLIPNSTTYGISKRLPDPERKRLRAILDKVKPKEHGLIVRTAAENITAEEIENDIMRLISQWEGIEKLATTVKAPALLYTEPDIALRVIREEFNNDYRKVVIDDKKLYEDVLDYVRVISPALADRVEYFDTGKERLSMFESHHVHEQLQKAVDRKVWLPSGGSLIIENTEALTVIDVNTGKNVGKKSLEETVYLNNLEAAEEVARQLRLRDIGGIIVIDFVDMEIAKNRDDVIRVFREALSRDKTRTQVFDISELGLVEMTRKRIGEGLIESVSEACEACDARGFVFDEPLLGELPVRGG